MSGDQRRLLVADSFRVRVNPQSQRAEVRGWSEHLERFRAGVFDVCAELDVVDPATRASRRMTKGGEFLGSVGPFIREIQDYGGGFPRLELWGGQGHRLELALSLRPLPQLDTELELRTAPGVRLEQATKKGPNIGRLTALNRELGAEALLTSGQGEIIEGATTSIVWWGGPHQVGYSVGDHSHRVASVTEKLLSNEGELTPSRISPGNLEASEVWAVNALHGIRVVTAIDGIPTQLPNEARLAHYRDTLDRHWEPVSLERT